MQTYVIGIEDLEERSLLTYEPFQNGHDGEKDAFFVDYTIEEMQQLLADAKVNAEENGVDPATVKLYTLSPVNV